MKTPPLTPDQKLMVGVYRSMQRALYVLVRFYGMTDPDQIMTPLTEAMDRLCKRWKIEPDRWQGR